MSNFIIAESGAELEQIKLLFLEYEQYLGFDLCFQGFERELAELPGKYARPEGRLYLIEDYDIAVGCAALRKVCDGICEMKRLYVREQFRGKKLGRMAAERLVADARSEGYEKMRLDTLPIMKEAVALYRSMGFTEIEPYCHNPIAGALYLELELV